MDLFLLFLTLAYLIVASVQDLRKREIYNWLSFSLIAFALAYRLFYSVVNSDFLFFIYGVGGMVLFIGLGYLLYYARVFAGGDAKLLFAIGACLPFSGSIYGNLISLGLFILLLLFLGGLWGLFYSLFLAFRNRERFSRELFKEMKKFKLLIYIALIVFVILLGFVFYLGEVIFLIIPFIILVLPFLYAYGKAIESSCMITSISPRELTIGDWLISSVRVGKKIIKPDWEGVSEEELEILKKYRGKVKIKVGIPFVPGFLLAFLAWIWLIKSEFLSF